MGCPRAWKGHDIVEQPEREEALLEEEAAEAARVLREEAARQAFIESVPHGLTLEGLGVLRWECYSRQRSQANHNAAYHMLGM